MPRSGSAIGASIFPACPLSFSLSLDCAWRFFLFLVFLFPVYSSAICRFGARCESRSDDSARAMARKCTFKLQQIIGSGIYKSLMLDDGSIYPETFHERTFDCWFTPLGKAILQFRNDSQFMFSRLAKDTPRFISGV